MAYIEGSGKTPSLFSAIAIGVGSIVGSGWLFASYFAAKFVGPASIISWVVGAAIALLLALLLAEIATMYQETGLFSRLLSITHNRDYGFIIAISNWFAMVAIIPSEAVATINYLGNAYKPVEDIMYNSTGSLTLIGLAAVWLIMATYGLLNYWGIKLLAKTNNFITIVKFVVPAATGFIFMYGAFHTENFTSYKDTFVPYGVGNIFTAIVSCGIFYAFYGFSLITVFAKEIKNPQRNLPLALIGSVSVCLVIYLILQVSFLGAIDPVQVATQGWHSLDFKSPLANVAALLGLNWLVILLYADAALSPSGCGSIYLGSGARMLQAMGEDKQMPSVFAKVNQQFLMSRTSLLFTLAICFIISLFFDTWQKIMVVVTVFQLISCVAIPIAFAKLRKDKANEIRTFKLPLGGLGSLISFLIVSYLLTQCGTDTLILSLVIHLFFMIVYCFTAYGLNPKQTFKSFLSSWSIFAYMLVVTAFGHLQDIKQLNTPIGLGAFIIISFIMYKLLVSQKEFK